MGTTSLHLSLWFSLSPSACDIAIICKSAGNMNYWKLCGFVCIWKCRNVHVDNSYTRTYGWICMISSIHMINMYVCNALLWWLMWETLTVQNNWPVCPHSTAIMTIYMITGNWSAYADTHLPRIVKLNIWLWSRGISCHFISVRNTHITYFPFTLDTLHMQFVYS